MAVLNMIGILIDFSAYDTEWREPIKFPNMDSICMNHIYLLHIDVVILMWIVFIFEL